MALTSKNSVLLDVDPSIIENNLLLTEPKDDDFNSLLSQLNKTEGTDSGTPWKQVKPVPGFCIKTSNMSGGKVFVNVCHTEAIPQPEDLSDSELLQILSSEESTSYRLPMSLANLHEELDKSGHSCSVYDVAINTSFFKKVEINQIFRTFFITVALEGLQDKYKLQLDLNKYTILKNRKVMGTLQYHRIEQRPVRGPQRRLIEEVEGDALVHHPTSHALPRSTLPLRLLREPDSMGDPPQHITAEIYVKSANCSEDLLLDLGEDRIVLHAAGQCSMLDVFLPYNVDQDKSVATFNVDTQILNIKMPVLT